jgi:hypothetical protein
MTTNVYGRRLQEGFDDFGDAANILARAQGAVERAAAWICTIHDAFGRTPLSIWQRRCARRIGSRDRCLSLETDDAIA